MSFPDFDGLRPPTAPNWALAAPGAGEARGAKRLFESPPFDAPPDRIITALAEVLAALTPTR